MIVKDVADHIKVIQSMYKIDYMVIDPASKQVVMELINRYDLPLLPAEKTDKHKHIELLNSDMLTGTIKLLDKECDKLVEELSTLVWDADKKIKGKYEEHPACPNHLADTMLYGWRYCFPYLWRPEEEDPDVDQVAEQDWEKEAKMLQRGEAGDLGMDDQDTADYLTFEEEYYNYG